MIITKEFLNKYDKSGPRYTSYPPATSFHTGFTEEDYINSLEQSNSEQPDNISIYIHIPFCPQRCYFCGCTTTGQLNKETTDRYIHCLLKEIENVAAHLNKKRKVSQVHWGGGTPNSIPMDRIKEVMDKLRLEFSFSPEAEIAMECNPALLDFDDIEKLSLMGFNRLSLGVQDFHIDILKAVNRKPSKHPVKVILKTLKEKGFRGVNLDLIYGLPLQTIENFQSTIQQTIEASPDRIATFSYAHVRSVNSEQKKLEIIGIPDAETKLSMLVMAYNLFTQNGYVAVGMDHFAKPEDDLAIAKINKTLHRNFQGYCTRETTGQVYAFGLSGISQLWGAYSQNNKDINAYMNSIEKSGFAVERGYKMTGQDKITREVINSLMCNGVLDFNSVASKFNTTPEELKINLAYDPSKLEQFISDGLLSIDGNTIRVSNEGMLVIRVIAMVFDPGLQVGDHQYSKTV